jgi:hypothetical protein
MVSVAIAGLVFVVAFGGALLGLWLRSILPKHHLTEDSKDVVKLGMGLIATMAALVLSLLITSAKASFDTQSSALRQIAASTIFLDRILAHYGAEAKDARATLRDIVTGMADQVSASGGTRRAPATRNERLYDMIQALSPTTDAQRSLQAQALATVAEAARTRWLLFEQREGGIPMPFLLMLACWLGIIFLSFAVYAPTNLTVVVTFFLCALSTASAMYLVMELDRPFGGIIRLPEAPLRDALTLLGR